MGYFAWSFVEFLRLQINPFGVLVSLTALYFIIINRKTRGPHPLMVRGSPYEHRWHCYPFVSGLDHLDHHWYQTEESSSSLFLDDQILSKNLRNSLHHRTDWPSALKVLS